ncbi:MAG: hypothetical protein NZ850_01320 [Caldimicrobium sp.]|nr:hypothetical protein [Caldimicrobium sp.]
MSCYKMRGVAGNGFGDNNNMEGELILRISADFSKILVEKVEK